MLAGTVVATEHVEDPLIDEPLLLGVRQRLDAAEPRGHLGARTQVPVPEQADEQQPPKTNGRMLNGNSGTGKKLEKIT